MLKLRGVISTTMYGWGDQNAYMIADFRFSSLPDRYDVTVQLFWEGDVRMGRIVLPAHVESARQVEDLPAGDTFPLISAIAYAMVLAASSSCPLCLAGDRTAWPGVWGNLVELN